MKKILAIGSVLFLAIVLVFVGYSFRSQSVGASGFVGQTYNSTTTTSVHAATAKVFRSGRGELGSIVIASSSGFRIRIYDACCTATSTATSTLIADFPANAVAGTYTFDRAINNGIVADVFPSFNGVYTITYR